MYFNWDKLDLNLESLKPTEENLNIIKENIKQVKNLESPLKPQIDINSLETSIHNLVNQERVRNGLSPLSYDSNLANIARKHSTDMVNDGFFSHFNMEGKDPTDRANEAGYSCRKDFGSYYTDGIAENIFQNNLYDSITYINGIPSHDWNSAEEIATSTVDGWMASEGHRENILTPHYDKEGIGIAISSNDGILITQNFC